MGKTDKSPETDELSELRKKVEKLEELTSMQAREIDKLNFENLGLWRLAEDRKYEHQAKKYIQESLKELDEYLASRKYCNIGGCSERSQYKAGLVLRERQNGNGVMIEPYLHVCDDHAKKLNMTMIQKRGDWDHITKGLDKALKPSILFSTVYIMDLFGKMVDKEDL